MEIKEVTNGIVVLLDALGASRFNIESCKRFIRDRDEIIHDGLLRQYCELAEVI